MEEVVVVAAIALLIIFGLPAVRALFRSFEAEGGAKAMISAALSTGRAIAAQQQRYAGIRFQNKYQQDGKGCQYMIFIVYDSEIPHQKQGNLGCRAAEGFKPIKLPDSIGVMEDVNSNSEVYDNELTDKTTFSIIFSPSSKLIIHGLWVRNRDGDTGNGSKDDIFNSKSQVKNGIGMLFQDESGDIEPSKNSFRIYDRNIFEKVDKNRRYDDYLKHLNVIYINPYTGTMIEK